MSVSNHLQPLKLKLFTQKQRKQNTCQNVEILNFYIINKLILH